MMSESNKQEQEQLLREKYNGISTPEYLRDCARLEAGEPLAYVIGHIPFLNTTIHLDSKPLIPRAESEHWLECALRDISVIHPDTSLQVLDIFAGSGALGIAWLAKRPQDYVTFAEIDPTHLAIIEKNIAVNALPANHTILIESDVWKNVAEAYDVIVCNPPYVPSTRTLPESVSAWEPETALYAGEDGLSYIRTFAEALHAHLAPNGVAYLEHDMTHAVDVHAIFTQKGYTTETHLDQYARERYTIIRS